MALRIIYLVSEKIDAGNKADHPITMSFLTIPPTTVPSDFPTEPAISYSFSLDAWQQHAITAIHRDEDVLVTAKTGSGKTLVGEYQIAYSLAKGERVFYTGPIKSLMNEKYKDLKRLFDGKASVGLLTGDIKINPDAQIIVMTTEILRNLLYKNNTATAKLGIAGHLSLKDLGAVIFDEVHYINDADRGHVWEESIILLPPTCRAILLSATMKDPIAFAEWVGAVRSHPITLLQTQHRIVPLEHGICNPDDPRFVIPYKCGDEAKFQIQVYQEWLRNREKEFKAADTWKATVNRVHEAGESAAGLQGKVKLHAFQHTMNAAIGKLQEKAMLPALFFVFSRANCESYAAEVSHTLIDASESAAMKHIVDFHLHKYMDVLLPLPQYHQILALLQKGIAFHHSGLLPILKEIIEILFAKGLIKVLFCTETFAVGLNMPARTVVFLDLKKPTDSGVRSLTPEEYIQMAGRAGRRGKDTKGTVLYLPARKPVDSYELSAILEGSLGPLRSRMAFHYEFLLKAIHKGGSIADTLLRNSYGAYGRRAKLVELAAEKAEVDEYLRTHVIAEDVKAVFKQRDKLESAVKGAKNAAQRRAQSELDTWRNAHRSAEWIKHGEDLVKEAKVLRMQRGLEMEIEGLECENDARRFRPVLEALKKFGAYDGTALTPLGIAATECNEANPLLIAKLYRSGLLKSCKIEEIVGVLASLVVDREAQEKSTNPSELSLSPHVCATLMKMDDWSQTGVAIDQDFLVLSPSSYWCLTTMWTDIVTKWLGGATAKALCEEYEIFPGNFMRGLLKVNNVVQEWISICTLHADVEQLATLDGIQERLMRDIVIPESLYLRL